MWTLGLNGAPIGWHDAAACLVDDHGAVVAMAEEERFTRVKHSPYADAVAAADWCLDFAGLTPSDLDVVTIGWDLARVLPQFGGRWEYADERSFLKQRFGWTFDAGKQPEVVCVPHHLAHALSTFHASGFPEAAVLVNDGNGEEESISIYEARAGQPLVRRAMWPRSHSLGYLYHAACEAIGYTFLEAGKTMGLASYGRASGMDPEPLLRTEGVDFAPPFDLSSDAGFTEVVAAWAEEFRRFGDVPLATPSAEMPNDETAVRIAWSAQATIERMVAVLVEEARRVTGIDAVCLAGGVALNCSTNGLLDGPVYVLPVPHDAGVSVGSAWALRPPTTVGAPLSPYLGSPVGSLNDEAPGWDRSPLEAVEVARRLMAGEVGAVAVGRAEVGPRALGHRSIIALPTSEATRDRVNDMKGRERWRPLAPLGLPSANGSHWQGSDRLQQYMLGAAEVTDRGREETPAIMHVDGTARAQVCSDIGIVTDVLRIVEAEGLPPVTINTSFNTRGEPVVNTAADAIVAAEKIGLDFVVIDEDLFTRS